MRISDWSSDVLFRSRHAAAGLSAGGGRSGDTWPVDDRRRCPVLQAARRGPRPAPRDRARRADHYRGRFDRDRKSVVSGESVSVRVDLGGRRIIKKKNCTYKSLQSIIHSNIVLI